MYILITWLCNSKCVKGHDIVLFVSGRCWLLYQLSLESSVLFLKSFCSPTELFTMNQHAMYCTDILYSVAVYDETTLFDTLKEPSKTYHICSCLALLKLFIKSDLASS